MRIRGAASRECDTTIHRTQKSSWRDLPAAERLEELLEAGWLRLGVRASSTSLGLLAHMGWLDARPREVLSAVLELGLGRAVGRVHRLLTPRPGAHGRVQRALGVWPIARLVQLFDR